MKVALFILISIVVIAIILFLPRIYKDIVKKRGLDNTYASQNVATGRDLRIYNARINNGAQLIVYSHHNWECLTWQMIEVADNTFLLKNLYTQKSFQPEKQPSPNITLRQQTLGGSHLQYWEFLPEIDQTYLIRLKDTDLYLTVMDKSNNAEVVLMPKIKSDNQRWRMIRQNPII